MSPNPSFNPPASFVNKAPREGIIAAQWIPADEGGRLRKDLLAAHLGWLKAKSIHGVMALGSTGEFPRMDLRTREEVVAAVIELSDPLPVIVNISSIRLDEVIALGQAAARLGAVGAALMPPPFYPLSQPDILEFFLRAAEAVDLPFYLYNYPEVTGNRIGPDVIASFADQARMAGLKQSGNELGYHDELIRIGREKDFPVFTAADPRLAEFMEKGASGCLGGLANFVPEYMVEVFSLVREGRASEAVETSARLARVGELLSPLNLPMNVRSGVEARGFNPGALKTVVSGATLSVYRSAVKDCRRAFQEWGLPIYAG